MKKKYSFIGLNFALLFLLTSLITAFRFIQLKFLTDFKIACDNFKTYNFFGMEFNSKTFSLFIQILVAVYIIFILFFVIKNKEDKFVCFYDLKKKSNMAINISLILFFILSIFCSFLFVKNFSSAKGEGDLSLYLNVASNVIFGLYFLYLFFCLLADKFNKQNSLNFIFVLPVIWGIVRMFEIAFLRTFSILTLREIAINNFKVASFTLFLFCLGKVLIGLNSRSNERYFIGFGFLSIFFGLISLIPRMIIYFLNISVIDEVTNSRVYRYNINIFEGTNYILFDLFILVFISLFLFTYMFRWKKGVKISEKD